MIWLGIVCLSALALIPLALTLAGPLSPRGRREAALALHRAQLAELARDRDEGRIGPAEHDAAVLEVQRRLLAAAGGTETGFMRGSRAPLIAALAALPVAAVLLYLSGGSPNLPAAPLAARMAAAEQDLREQAALINKLKQVLAQLDPHSEKSREGYVLLGSAEARMGDIQGAAAAWETALAERFDPTLAVETAEAASEAAGRVTDKAAGLFRRALAEAPPDAPWRKMAERRLAEHDAAATAGGKPAN
ncbi:MAG TPA: c-type cytochrome biogenesis protein CcmI [Acetobacteraceae bacterium]|nr:c-type cytochrome biogenesis protein CcmI [Acetobacteraceae bacterium]